MPTFDGENLIVTLDPAPGGVAEVDVFDHLYEPWKDWMLEKPGNRRYPPVFSSDGGKPLTTTIDQGSYIFLNNATGWRIKPYEQDGTWYFIGNLAVESTSLPAVVSTDGAFTAAILGLQPITQGVTEEGIGRSVWNASTSDHDVAGSFGAFIQKKLLTVKKYLGLK